MLASCGQSDFRAPAAPHAGREHPPRPGTLQARTGGITVSIAGTKVYLRELLVSRWEHTFTYLLLSLSVLFTLVPPGFNPFTGSADGHDFMQGSFAMQAQWGSLFALAAFLVWKHRHWAMFVLKATNPFLILILLYCALSIVWSEVPISTLKKVVQFVGVILIAVAIQITRTPLPIFIGTLLFTLTVIMVLSFFTAVLNPAVGVDYVLGGAWRGILPQKNYLGVVGAISALVWLNAVLTRQFSLATGIVGFLFSMFMLVMSMSSTSLVITLVGLMAFVLLRRPLLDTPYWLQRALILALVLLLIGYQGFYIYYSRPPTWDEIMFPLTSLLGKGTDLTGRMDIWQMVLPEYYKHPMFGIGYGAFWLGPGSPSQPILDQLYWIPYQAHNGYIDILNELGVMGFLLVLGFMGWHIHHLLRLARCNRNQATFHGVLFAMIVIANFTESTLFRSIVFWHVMLVYSSVSVSTSLTLYCPMQRLGQLVPRATGRRAAGLR